MRKCETRKLPSAMGEKRQLFYRLLNAEVSVVNVVTYAVCMRRCNVTKRVEHIGIMTRQPSMQFEQRSVSAVSPAMFFTDT